MRKHFTASFKAQVVQELLKEDKTMAQMAAEYEVHPTQLNKWKSTALAGLPGLFEEKDSLAVLKASHEEQLNKLYAEIGRLTTQVAWLKKKSGLEPQ
jgi:putative transposase